MSYPTVDLTTTDVDTETICPGCVELIIAVSNNQIYLTFGTSENGRAITYGQPEPYLPITGAIARRFDAFKVRSKLPGTPAIVQLTPVPG